MYFLNTVFRLFKVYGLCQKQTNNQTKQKTKQNLRKKNLNMTNTTEYEPRNYLYALQSYSIFSILHYESCNLKQAVSK